MNSYFPRLLKLKIFQGTKFRIRIKANKSFSQSPKAGPVKKILLFDIGIFYQEISGLQHPLKLLIKQGFYLEAENHVYLVFVKSLNLNLVKLPEKHYLTVPEFVLGPEAG